MARFVEQVLQKLGLQPTPEQQASRAMLGEYINGMRNGKKADFLIEWYQRDSARVRILERSVEESHYLRVVRGQIQNRLEGYFPPDPKEWDWALTGHSAERE